MKIKYDKVIFEFCEKDTKALSDFVEFLANLSANQRINLLKLSGGGCILIMIMAGYTTYLYKDIKVSTKINNFQSNEEIKKEKIATKKTSSKKIS